MVRELNCYKITKKDDSICYLPSELDVAETLSRVTTYKKIEPVKVSCEITDEKLWVGEFRRLFFKNCVKLKYKVIVLYYYDVNGEEYEITRFANCGKKQIRKFVIEEQNKINYVVNTKLIEDYKYLSKLELLENSNIKEV